MGKNRQREGMTGRILIIEDEPSLSKELTSALDEADFSIAAVPDFPDAMRKLADFKPDMIIMDAVLPSGDGMDTCRQLRNTLGVPVVLIGSEDSSAELWERVMEAEADLYLVKPLRYWELVARVKAILRRCSRMGVPRYQNE